MYISSLKLHNFMSYIDCNIDGLNASGVIGVISGDSVNSNGIGKTNLINHAISFCITGNASFNLENLIRIGENEMQTSIKLKDKSDANNYIIIDRNRHRFELLKNSIKINDNGNNIDIKNNREIQQYINTRLNTSYDNFIKYNTLSNFMSLSNNEKIKYIENLYNNIKWENYYYNCLEVLKTINSKIDSLSGKIEILENSKLNDLYNIKVNKLKEIDAEIADLKSKLNEYNIVKNTLESFYNEYNKNIELKKNISKQIESLVELKNTSTCPTCYNKIDLNILNGIINNKKEELLNIECLLSALKDKVDSFLLLTDNINNSTTSLNTLLHIRSNISKEINEFQNLINEQATQLTELKNSLQIYQKDVLHYTFLKDLVIKEGSKFRTSFIQEYLLILSKLVNQYLSQIEMPLSCLFLLNDDNEIETKFSIPVNYTLLSSGQKKLFDICLTLGLFDIYRSLNKTIINVLIFDEFLNFLDNKNEENLVYMLDMYAKSNNTQIFLVSPRSLKGNISQNIIIEYDKEKGCSTAHVV